VNQKPHPAAKKRDKDGAPARPSGAKAVLVNQKPQFSQNPREMEHPFAVKDDSAF
jgi:hypothetical protein